MKIEFGWIENIMKVAIKEAHLLQLELAATAAFALKHSQFPLQFQTFTSNIHIGKDVKHNYYVHQVQASNSAEYF